MKEFIESEIKIINNLFKHNRIMARVVKAENVLSSFIRYHLSLHVSQQFVAVEKIQRELAAALAKNRQRFKFSATDIMTVVKPTFGLEVSLPNPKPLLWPIRKVTTLEPDKMLCGVSAVDSSLELLSLKDSPHCLIAGMTNAGKSVLLQMMLLSLCANNSPESLKLVLIDLKNEDLTPFKKLPHVLSFNTDLQSATVAIEAMIEEKNKRIVCNSNQRIVLVIDELAQLAFYNRKLSSHLGDLASIGRSKKLNLLAATQSVTKDGGIGSMMKANFSCRMIGKVAPGLSALATGLPKMQAHLLPGYGSFLRIEGDKTHRFQSYFIEPNDVTLMVKHITDKWNSVLKSVLNGSENGSKLSSNQFYTSENETQLRTVLRTEFPIDVTKTLTSKEKEEIYNLANSEEFQYAGKPSLTKLSNHVFGFKNGLSFEKIKEVLSDSIMA